MNYCDQSRKSDAQDSEIEPCKTVGDIIELVTRKGGV